MIAHRSYVFTPEKLQRMFEAFDSVRDLTPEAPEFVAKRIMDAAATGATTVDKLVEAAMSPYTKLE